MSRLLTEAEALRGLPDQKFACSFGHVVMARNAVGAPEDLEGVYCPVCVGAIKGHAGIILPQMLAPVQEPS